jgi:hypothetical protein
VYGKIGLVTQTNFAAGTLQAGATCTISGTEPAIGSMVTGSISLTNGASVPFSGVWT